MNNIYQHYIIDLSSNSNFVQIPTVQGDGNNIRGFEVELIENGVQYEIDKDDCVITIMGTKPDTSQIMNDCKLTDDGYILVDITSQMSAVKGRGDYQIVLMSKSTNSQLKSFPFHILTTPATFDVDHITSSDEFQFLTKNIVRVEVVIDEANDTISDMRDLEKSVADAEKDRVDAEEKRVDAEDIRISNENTRQINEATRQDNETIRKSSEDTRQSNESDRQIGETARTDAENIRIANEETRETNEAERIKAEADRINAEADRSAAEEDRITSENTRKFNEDVRKASEEDRINAELIRNETEDTRNNAENIRMDNESDRQTNESIREANESERQINTAIAISNAEEATNRANAAAEKANQPVEGIDYIYQQATGYTDQKIADLINGAPSTLDTLGEIAQAMQNNADVVEALEDAIGSKASEAEFSSYKNNTNTLIGNTDISDVGDGTITGAIDAFHTQLNTEISDLKKSVADGKASLASAITEKGVPTAQDATFAVLAENIGSIFTGGGGDNITLAGKPLVVKYDKGATTAVASIEITDDKKYLIVADGGEVNLNLGYDALSAELTVAGTAVGTVLNSHYMQAGPTSGAMRRKNIFYVTDGTNQTITLTVKATTFNGYGDGSGKYEQVAYAEIIAFRLE